MPESDEQINKNKSPHAVQLESDNNPPMTSKKDGVTPMMLQFFQIKAEQPEAILFYRMGDFYELFFDDAIKAAEILDITLTKRGKHLGEDIPMCGVPVHSHEGYLNKLIASGLKVAICEQMEDCLLYTSPSPRD